MKSLILKDTSEIYSYNTNFIKKTTKSLTNAHHNNDCKLHPNYMKSKSTLLQKQKMAKNINWQRCEIDNFI